MVFAAEEARKTNLSVDWKEHVVEGECLQCRLQITSDHMVKCSFEGLGR